MSHVTKIKTTIKNPNLGLLRQAVAQVAQVNQGQIANQYKGFYRDQVFQVEEGLALFTPALRRGLGLAVNSQTGELELVGDFWGVQAQAEQLKQQIVQAYVLQATAQALTQRGYLVQAAEGENNSVILTGVAHA